MTLLLAAVFAFAAFGNQGDDGQFVAHGRDGTSAATEEVAPALPTEEVAPAPEQSGGTTDVPIMQGPVILQRLVEWPWEQDLWRKSPSENESDSVLGTSPSYADHVEGPEAALKPPPQEPSPGAERFNPSPVAAPVAEALPERFNRHLLRRLLPKLGRKLPRPIRQKTKPGGLGEHRSCPFGGPSTQMFPLRRLRHRLLPLRRPRMSDASRDPSWKPSSCWRGPDAERVGGRFAEASVSERARGPPTGGEALGLRLRAEADEPLPLLSHFYGPPSPSQMYDSLALCLTDRSFLTRVALGGGGSSQDLVGGATGVSGRVGSPEPEEYGEETPYVPPRPPRFPEQEQQQRPQQKLLIDQATITDNALEEWHAWLKLAQQGRSLREWGLTSSDVITAVEYLGEVPPQEEPARGGRWTNAPRGGGRKKHSEAEASAGIPDLGRYPVLSQESLEMHRLLRWFPQWVPRIVAGTIVGNWAGEARWVHCLGRKGGMENTWRLRSHFESRDYWTKRERRIAWWML